MQWQPRSTIGPPPAWARVPEPGAVRTGVRLARARPQHVADLAGLHSGDRLQRLRRVDEVFEVAARRCRRARRCRASASPPRRSVRAASCRGPPCRAARRARPPPRAAGSEARSRRCPCSGWAIASSRSVVHSGTPLLGAEGLRPVLRARVDDLDAVAIALPVQRSGVEEADETRAQHAHPVADHASAALLARRRREHGAYAVPRGRQRAARPSRDARARRSSEVAAAVRGRDRRRRARPPLRHRPLADPGRGDVPALRLVSGLPPDRRALDDLPHAGRRRERAAAGDVHRAGRGPRRDDPRQLRARAAGRDDRLQRGRPDRGADRDGDRCDGRGDCRSSR